MARLRGRAPRGERCRAGVPHGHWKTTTFTGALRLTGMTAPFVYDGAMNGNVFLAYVEQVLVPTLSQGDVVIMDMCTPPLVQGAWSGADMCPASVAAVTCRGPVWEFAERVQNNLARSRRVSMIWFSPLIDRSAILSVRPSHTLAARLGSGLPCQSRCPVDPAIGHNAHRMRAVLLARAMITSMGGLRLSIWESQGSAAAPLRIA